MWLFLFLVPFLFEVVVYFTLFLCKFVHENMLVVNLKDLLYQQRYGKRLIIISINIMVFPDFVFKHVCAVMGVYFTEKINYYLGQNWEKFATQDYFDKHGFFLSNLWSSPLLMISTIFLVCLMKCMGRTSLKKC